MERHRHNQIRLPPFQLLSAVNAKCPGIKITVFPASVILESYNGTPPFSAVEKDSPSLSENMFPFSALFTVLFLLFYRFSAFHASGSCKRLHLPAALPAHQAVLCLSQYLMTERTSLWIQHIQKQFCYFVQKRPFSPMAPSSCSASSLILRSREL